MFVRATMTMAQQVLFWKLILGLLIGQSFFHNELVHLALTRTLQLLCGVCIRAVHVVATR